MSVSPTRVEVDEVSLHSCDALTVSLCYSMPYPDSPCTWKRYVKALMASMHYRRL